MWTDAIVLLFALAFPAGAASAQAGGAEPAAAAAQEKGSAAPAPQDAAAWKRELARVRLLVEVDGKLDEARAEVLRLQEQLERAREFEGRAQVVVEYLEFATALYDQLGETERASALLDPDRASTGWKAVLATVRDDLTLKRIRFLHNQAVARQRAAPTSADAARIEQIVRKAVADGSPNAIEALGVAAAPTLEVILREEPEALPDWPKDALLALVEIAPARAASVCLELLQDPRAGFLLRKRILRAMNSGHGVLRGDGGAWRFESLSNWNERPPVLLQPAWRDVLTAVMTSPLVAVDAMPLVARLVDYDALDEPLRGALLALARSGEPGAAAGVAKALESGALRSSVRPLLEALLASPAIELRLVAANHLALEPRSEALLARVDDPEPRVREAVARALDPDGNPRPRFHPNGGAVTGPSVRRGFQERDRPVLMRLLADADVGVRRAALDVAWKADQRLEPATAEKLLAVGDVEARGRVPRLLPKDPAVAAPLLERALHDGAVEVRTEAETELLARFGIKKHASGGTTTELPEIDPTPALLPLALATLDGDGPRLGRASKDRVRWALVAVLVEDPDDCRAFVRWWLDAPDGHGLATAEVADRLASSARDRIWPQPWSYLDEDTLYAVLRRAVAEDGPPKELSKAFGTMPKEGLAGDVLARLVSDPEVSRAVRLEVLPRVARHPRAADCAVSVLRSPRWEESEGVRKELSRFAQWTTAEVLRAVLAKVWDDTSVPDSARLALLDSPLAPAEYAGRALGLDPSRLDVSDDVVRWALATEGAAGRWGAAHVLLQRPGLRGVVVGVLGQQRPPEALAWLGEVLLDARLDAPVRAQAAGAIAGYLSDEAADLLLRGAAAAPDENVRGACLDGVEQIRTYLDQKASWQRRATGVAQRDAAVAELVGLLDAQDPGQRAQAARGLATLAAVEHLPRLIRMLQDPDAGVRKAVQEALERLNSR